MTTFERTVKSAKEYREIVENAKTLGFVPADWDAYGTWEAEYVGDYEEDTWQSVDSEPCWPGNCEVKDVGQKYFTVEMDDTDSKIKPVRSERMKDGKLVVTFRD